MGIIQKRRPALRPFEWLLAAYGKKLYRLARRLPYGKYTDRMVFYAQFLARQKRLPRRGGSFVDFVFYLKRDDKLSNDLQALTTDKELVKDFLASTIGAEHVAPTFAVLRSETDIDAYAFPDQCYIKGTASSGLLIAHDGGALDRQALKGWLSENQYAQMREQHYRRLVPKIIVEPYYFGTKLAREFRVFCHRGSVRFIVCTSAYLEPPGARAFDRNWTDLGIAMSRPLFPAIPRPVLLDRMIDAAETIGTHFDFVRADMYTDENAFLVGELTHCPGSANSFFVPPEGERTIDALMFADGA